MLMHLLPTTCHFQQKHNSVFVPQKQEDNGQKYIGTAAKQQCANTTSTFTGTWPTTQWRTATQGTSKTQTRAKQSRQITKKRCIQMNALLILLLLQRKKEKKTALLLFCYTWYTIKAASWLMHTFSWRLAWLWLYWCYSVRGIHT